MPWDTTKYQNVELNSRELTNLTMLHQGPKVKKYFEIKYKNDTKERNRVIFHRARFASLVSFVKDVFNVFGSNENCTWAGNGMPISTLANNASSQGRSDEKDGLKTRKNRHI